MTTAKQIREPRTDYLALEEPALLRGFELLATAEGGVAKLRNLILSLAMRGLLTQKNPDDEPAGELILEVQQEKKRLIDTGALKRTRSRAAITEGEQPYSLPAGWEWVRLNDLLIKIGAGSTPRGGREVYTTTGIKFLRSQNVWNHGLALAGVARIPTAVHDKMSGTKVIAGDLLFNITGASIGRCALVPDNFDEANVSQHVTIIRAALPNIRQFLHLVLISAHVQQTVMDVQVGVSREGLSIGKLGQFVIPLPPLAEQHRIVARVEELMTLCDELEARGRLADEQHTRLTTTLFDALTASDSAQTLADNWQRIATHFDLLLDRPQAIDALEQTILQLAVRGLLVPQDPIDEPASKLLARMQKGRGHKRKFATPSDEAIDALEWRLPDSWCWASIDQISEDDERAITDGPFGANLKTEHYVDRPGYRVIRLQNIGHNEFRDEHRAYIDESRFNSLQKHQVCGGDLVVAGLIDTSIRCCVVPDHVGPAIVKADCYRLSVHSIVSSAYIANYLNSATAREFASIHHHGLTLTRIGLGNFRTIPVPLPPLAEQHRIVARVEQLRSLCDNLRGRLNKVRATQTHLAEALVTEAVQPQRGVRLG